MSAPKDVGQWETKFDLKNVCIHASLLPTGKILYWGRRSDCKSQVPKTLDEQLTLPFIWDPNNKDRANSTPAPKPVNLQGVNVNLFCSGHCFQPDGKLLVVGGHMQDGVGITQTCLYDFEKNIWIAQNSLTSGRWYPSVLTLPDGRPLAISGSNDIHYTVEKTPQIFTANAWGKIADPPNLNLYPRLYLDKDGKVFMAGPQAQPSFLNLSSTASTPWEEKGKPRKPGVCEYAASVLYDVGKVMYTGGGTNPPTDITNIIDLNVKNPEWKPAKNLGVRRQQASATVLPDGTVLVTGGTRGEDFNNLGKDKDGPFPVHTPELWNPDTDTWVKMAPEDEDRCYHSIALLLPDGRVLSAGGGEWAPTPNVVNLPEHSLRSAQIFTPPYLFDDKNKPAVRPTISMPKLIFDKGEEFDITVGGNDKITKVSWIRLGSVTHCTNFNQAVYFQKSPKQTNNKVTIQVPANENVAPPGHYMLFVLNQNNVPAIAPIVSIKLQPASTKSATFLAKHIAVEQHTHLSVKAQDEKIISEQERPPVVVGLTASCPYGLGPCWGGAFEALKHISDVKVVRPLPNHHDSVAYVYTKQDTLPDIDLWRSEFQKINANTHTMRGIEITLSGAVSENPLGTGKQLTLTGTSTRPELILEPFQATSKIEWDLETSAPKLSSDAETGAFERLSRAVAEHPGARMQVTGPLQKHGADKYSLEVRDFEALDVLTSQ